MPRSSRHKSHKHSKHSRDYSDSDEDVIKTEKRSKDEISTKAHRDSASGEKRKVSSQVREGKDRDLSGQRNGDVLEEHASSKRRKEKFDDIGGDRWSGGVDERGDSDSNVEKEMHEGERLKLVNKVKENISKSENLEVYSSSKSKLYESGVSGERKEDGLASLVAAKEESKGKGESRRRSERDSSARKEGKELKEKGHRSDREKNGGQEIKGDGATSKERQGKRSRENTDHTLLDEMRSPELDKEVEKKMHKKREGSSERDIHHVDSKDTDERPLPSRSDRAKDVKYRDDKHKDGGYTDKYQEDGHKDERRRDEKHKDEVDKYNKYQDDKYREDVEKDSRRRADRHRQDGDRDGRRKDEKCREDGERDSMRKDGKYLDSIEREGRRDDKYHEDADRENRHKDGRYGEKDIRRVDERCLEDGNTDDRHRDSSRRDDENRDSRYKEEKYRKGIDRDIRHKDSKQGDGHDREKRPRDTRYRDELASRDRPGHKSDSKRARDDDYNADHHSRKSGAYDDSPTHDDRTARYRDDQRRRRKGEKEDFGAIGSQPTKDRRADTEKKSASNEIMDIATDKVKSSSRTADMDLSSSHGRRHSSPTSSAHAAKENYRALKQDEYKYRDCSYDEKYRHNIGGSDKTSSRSMEKLGQRDEDHLHDLAAERRLKSDAQASSLEHVDKSPPSSTDRRQFNRADVRRSIDVEESTHRSSGSRDLKEHFTKEGKAGRELVTDVHPGEEILQDAETLSVSSPFMRNNHFSNSSKSLPLPAPVRTGLDSPSPLGLAEDEGRGRSSIRYRRIGDPSMGRIQGNSWRGPPNWPSHVSNGFLPFPPPVGFHSVMHPFPAPPLFGVRPPMELDHPSPYHMPDADRFSGPGHPMGWCPQINNSGPPLHAWEANNAVFADESHFYGRSDWDHSGNIPGDRGWEMSEDLSRWPNRTTGMEMPSSNKDNALTQSGDEALDGQSLQPTQNEQSQADQQALSTDLSQWPKNSEKNEVVDPLVSLEDSSNVSKVSWKNDMHLCNVYLSKLDISTDLTEPELFNKCTGLIDIDQNLFSGVDDTNVLYVGGEEDKMASHRFLSSILFIPTDDSVFQKSMSLYWRQKVNFSAEDGEKLNLSSNFILNMDQEDTEVEDVKTEKLYPDDDLQDPNDALPNIGTNVDSEKNLQKADIAEISKELLPPSDANMLNSASNLGQLKHEVEEKPLPAGNMEGSDSPLPSEPKHITRESACDNEEAKSVDTTKCGSMLSTDMSPEAMLPESGSVNLSRIHRSPENTH